MVADLSFANFASCAENNTLGFLKKLSASSRLERQENVSLEEPIYLIEFNLHVHGRYSYKVSAIVGDRFLLRKPIFKSLGIHLLVGQVKDITLL